MSSDRPESGVRRDGAQSEEGAGGPAKPAPSPSRPTRAPEQTSDDTDVGWGEVPEAADAHERWLQEQRPPHWD